CTVSTTLRLDDRSSAVRLRDNVALFFCRLRPPPTSTLFPYTTLFRSRAAIGLTRTPPPAGAAAPAASPSSIDTARGQRRRQAARSEEHTSELQSRSDLVCRLLLEKKKTKCHSYRIR